MEHRLITGGYEFLPFARSCITKLKKLGLPYADQSYEVNGVSIKVRIEPGHEYIRIESGGSRYEFFAADALYVADPLIPGDLSSGPGTKGLVNPLDSTVSYMSGCGVEHVKKGKAKPIFSMTLKVDPNDPGQKWVMSTFEFLKTVEQGNPRREGDFTTTHSWADQNFQQHHWWKDNKPSYLVTSVCASGRGRSWTSQEGKWYTQSALTYREMVYGDEQDESGGYKAESFVLRRYISNQPWYTYLTNTYTDTTYPRWSPLRMHEGAGKWDIRPSAHTQKSSSWGGHKRSPQVNWRHAAVQTVIGTSGKSYNFMISTDTHGGFTVYPVADYTSAWSDMQEGDVMDSIPARFVKVVTPKYPSWVTQPALDKTTSPDHFQWEFNSTATKAATTPINKVDAYVYALIGRRTQNGVTDTRVYSCLADTGQYTAYDLYAQNYNPPSTHDPSFVDVQTIERVRVMRMKTGANPDVKAWESLDADRFQLWRTSFELSYEFAFVIDNRLIPMGLLSGRFLGKPGTSYANSFSVASVTIPQGMTLPAKDYEPATVTTPGFMEVSIEITVDDPDNEPMTYDVQVSVIDQEEYTTNNCFFMDVGYYISTPRTRKSGLEQDPDEEIKDESLPANDMLLTGEIELYWMPTKLDTDAYDVVSTPPDAAKAWWAKRRSSQGAEHARALRYRNTWGAGYDVYNDLRPVQEDFPNLTDPHYGLSSGIYNMKTISPKPLSEGYRAFKNPEGALLGAYCGMHLYAYYTVRGRKTKKVIKRLCLAHDVDWQTFELNWRDNGRKLGDESVPKSFFGAVEQSELRFISFITRSYCRNAATDPAKVPTSPYDIQAATSPRLLPRFELRVYGEALETVDYSSDNMTGFKKPSDINSNAEFGYDPMTELSAPPEGSLRLPLTHTKDILAVPEASSTNGFTYCMLQWLSFNMFDITHNDCFSFSPAGHWSVYADRRAIDFPIRPTSTVATGVFDIIYDHKDKKKTSHKDAFNAAFKQKRDYTYYDPAKGDMGGFASTGIWIPT